MLKSGKPDLVRASGLHAGGANSSGYGMSESSLLLDMGASSAETPHSNTGLDSRRVRPSVSVDGLTFLWSVGGGDVLSCVALFTGIRIDLSRYEPRRIGVMWDRVYRSPGGSLYCCRTVDGQQHYRLALSGGDLHNARQDMIYYMSSALLSVCSDIRCSRMDVAFDDWSKSLDPTLIVASVEDGLYSGFRSASYIRNLGTAGFTLYLGSRESESFCRYYNKDAESAGRIDSYRFETEYKGAKADFFWHCYATAATSVASIGVLSSISLSDVMFYSTKHKNLSRSVVSSWWSEFLSLRGCDGISYPPQMPVSSIDRTIGWIRRQVSRSLGLVRRSMGSVNFDILLSELIADGEAKLRRMDDLRILQHYECNYA